MSLHERLPRRLKPGVPTLRKSRWDRLAPFAFGAGVIAAGALMSRFRPSILDTPDPVPMRGKARGRVGTALTGVRDGAHQVAPENMSAQLGRSLMLAGAAMLVARALDEVSALDL